MPVVIIGNPPDQRNATVLWQNFAEASQLVASSSATGYPVAHVADPGTALAWRPTSATSNITLTRPSAVTCNGIGIAAHNLASTGTTVILEYSTNGTTYTALHSYSALTNDEVMFNFSQVTARWWRLRFTGGIPTIGVVVIGGRLTFPSAPEENHTPLNHARQYDKYFNDSLGGNFIGTRVRSAGAETEANFPVINRPFVDTLLRGFESHYNQGGKFFYAGCPLLYPNDMGYCRAGSDSDIINVTYTNGNRLAELSFSLRAYVGY